MKHRWKTDLLMSSRLQSVVLFCLLAASSYAQVFTEFPRNLQFYARDAEDSAVVPISGSLYTPGYDSIYIKVLRNGVLRKRISHPLSYSGGVARFNFEPKIVAELAEYSLRVHAKNIVDDDSLAGCDSVVAGDVYLIAGQSNAVLCRSDVKWRNEFCRTFGNYNSPFARDTNWAVSVADTNDRNPAVGVWALHLQKKLVDAYKRPICIINGAVGGKTIESMLRTDSDPTKLSTIYGMMLNRVRKAGLAQHAKAIFWYQGESNSGGSYFSSFSTLYNDWKEDYPNVEKVYVFQIRPGCNINREHAQLREVQRTLPRSFPDIRTISTMGIPYHDGCHFTTQGYEIVAERVFSILSRDFYGSTDTMSLDGPNISQAFYTDGSRTEIALIFSPLGSTLSITPDVEIDSVKASMKEYFYLDNQRVNILALTTRRDTLLITLTAPSDADSITYLPDKYYYSTLQFYEGPWIVNERGIGAFSFWRFPIESPQASVRSAAFSEETFAVYPNPITNYATFIISLEKDDNITIELFDLLGRKVKTVVEESLAAGTYKIPFEVESSFNRAMIARLRTSDGLRSVQVMIVR